MTKPRDKIKKEKSVAFSARCECSHRMFDHKSALVYRGYGVPGFWVDVTCREPNCLCIDSHRLNSTP